MKRGGGVSPYDLRELIRQAETAGMADDEEVRAAIFAAVQSGSPEMVRVVGDRLGWEASKRALEGDPFFPYPRPEELGSADHGIPLGMTHGVGMPLHWGLDEVPESGLITGAIKGGKTNLLLQICRQMSLRGVNFVAFDRRFDFWPLTKALDDVGLVTTSGFKLNPFCPPRGVPRAVWWERVVQTFAHCFDLLIGSTSFLLRALDMVNEVMEKTGQLPTLADWELALRNVPCARYGAERDYRARTVSRLEAVIHMAGHLFDCQRGFDLSRWLEQARNVIFVWDMEEEHLSSFLQYQLMWFVHDYRKYNYEREHEPMVIAIDEGRSLLRERRSEHFVPEISTLATSMRRWGWGLLSPSSCHRSSALRCAGTRS